MNIFNTKIFLSLVICLVYETNLCAAQIKLPKINLPTPTAFLSWLFNCTTSETDGFIQNFVFGKVAFNDVELLLYPKIKSNSTNRSSTPSSYTELITQPIDLTKPTKIIVHGWQSNGTSAFIRKMANEYNENYNYTVLSVEWSKHSKRNYIHAASSTRDVGRILGDFILKSINNNTALMENVHLIGHSLGAHVCGFTGKYIIARTGNKISRITGLDAASPLFEFPVPSPHSQRITKSDATFVDGIHTNAGFLGVRDAFGDVDFYVNFGGPIQPECFNLLNMFESIICSHSKSHEYYSETIIGKRFETLPCPKSLEPTVCNTDVNVRMGEDVSRSASGIYAVISH